MSDLPNHLVLEVRLFQGQFHGVPDWPPSPARLFQALVAATSDPGAPSQGHATLEWLETLDAPLIFAPRARRGADVVLYVPNNDLDSVGGDPARVGEIRAPKHQSRHLFDPEVPIVYAWPLTAPSDSESPERLTVLSELAQRIYQFGRGIDPAWARATTCTHAELSAYARRPGVTVWRPGGHRGRGPLLDVPAPGSLHSLEQRHEIQRNRLTAIGAGKRAHRVFEQAPRPRFAAREYGSGPHPLVVALRPTGSSHARRAAFEPWPLSRAHDLVIAVRDAAHDRLAAALKPLADEVRRQLIGRRPDEHDGLPPDQRVRIVPLPSIGSQFTDQSIRRLVVLIPDHGPITHEDLEWAFTGLEVTTPSGGSAILERADGDTMGSHYGLDTSRGHRKWRSVTPVAIPRLRRHDTRRNASNELDLLDEVRHGLTHALRHAEVDARTLAIRPLRSSPDPRGAAAREFAAPPRFTPDRLWHVEIDFAEPCRGPLVIGDGRYLGLGVLAPIRASEPRAVAVISGLEVQAPHAEDLVRAFRRALLAMAQETLGARERLPEALTGHRADGRPARGHRHLHIAWDFARARFFLIPPARSDDAALLDEALSRISMLRAGRAGHLELSALPVDVDDDPLLRPALQWRSVTPYTVCRHERRGEAHLAIEADVRRECRRSGLPAPQHVIASKVEARSGEPLRAHVELTFDVAVRGPVILGRTRHKGGGLFEAIGGPAPSVT